MPKLAYDGNGPARLAREAVDLAKSKPGAFAGRLRCEEWLENLGEVLLRNAETSVLYPDENKIAR